jgi:hypothetical protein
MHEELLPLFEAKWKEKEAELRAPIQAKSKA